MHGLDSVGSGSASGGGPANAARELQLLRAFAELHQAIEVGAKLTEQLEARLQPALAPMPPPPPSDPLSNAKVTPSKAPLVENLDSLVHHVRTQNIYLQALLTRLEF